MNKLTKHLKITSELRARQTLKALSTVRKKLFDKLDDFAEQYTDYQLSKKAIRELSLLNNRMLKDVGIDKADVTRIAMAENPSVELRRLNSEETRNYKKRKDDCLLASTAAPTSCTACC